MRRQSLKVVILAVATAVAFGISAFSSETQSSNDQAAISTLLAMLDSGDTVGETGFIILAQSPSRPTLKPKVEDKPAQPKPVVTFTEDFIKNGVLTYPKSGAALINRRPIIGADYRGLPDEEASMKPLLFVNSKDVTAECDIHDGYIFYTPPSELAEGRHEAVVKLADNTGTAKIIANWSFTVTGTKPLRFAYPPPDITLDNKRPIIGLNLGELPQGMDPASVRLFVDGADVTSQCDITEDYIFYSPKKDLSMGRHLVEIHASSVQGKEQQPVTWAFNVVETAQTDKYAEAGETGEPAAPEPAPKVRHSNAAAIAGAGRQPNTLARSSAYAEAILGPPPGMAPETAPGTYAGAPTGVQPKKTITFGTVEQAAKTPEQGVEQESAEEETGGGLEYALETTAGIENMDVDGQEEESSQRSRNAMIYRIGIRAQSALTSGKKDIFQSPMFSVNARFEGTSDGDESESMTDLKNLTAIVQDDRTKLSFYEIKPKFTPFTLMGQRLLGGEVLVTHGDQKYHLFTGKFKKPRAGKRIYVYGFRYSDKTPSGMDYGINGVVVNMHELRGGTDSSNTVLAFDFQKKYKFGENKFEWALSRYSDLYDDTAYHIENTYRKDKMFISTKYETVGSFFRTEGGFASYGLVEFNTSLQYQFSKRFTSIVGYRRRDFMEGGSQTVSTPFILKLIPFDSKPATTLEYRYKIDYYTSGSNWKDTYTTLYDARHKIGTNNVQMSYQTETKKRNSREDENERILNINVRSPLNLRTDITYKLTKLDNNLFGPESKNSFGVSYELSDWSDVRVTYENVNKVQPTLDRTTRQIRFGKLDPETNTEMSFEFDQSLFLLYDETFYRLKYSVFY